MHTTELARILAVAGMFAAPLMAQSPHPRPATEHIHLQKGGTATPDPMDLKNAHMENGHNVAKDATKVIIFNKPAGGAFTVKFSGPNPCLQPTINNAQPNCTLKPGVCPGPATCTFSYSAGAGDPDIVIDPGYSSPPPQPGDVKGKKDPAPKKQ